MCEPMPERMRHAKSAMLGDKVCVGGGITPNTSTASNIYIYDFIAWKTVKSPTRRSALTTYQERLVLVGGRDPSTGTPTNKLWMMDNEQTWTQPLPLMPTPRWGASAVTVQNNLIVAGGKGTVGAELDVVEVFDGQQWATAQPLPRGCYDMKSAIHNGNWYLIGGRGQVFCASLESLVASAQSKVTGSVWKTLPPALIVSPALLYGEVA